MKYAPVVFGNRFVGDGPTQFKVPKSSIFILAHFFTVANNVGRENGCQFATGRGMS